MTFQESSYIFKNAICGGNLSREEQIALCAVVDNATSLEEFMRGMNLFFCKEPLNSKINSYAKK